MCKQGSTQHSSNFTKTEDAGSEREGEEFRAAGEAERGSQRPSSPSTAIADDLNARAKNTGRGEAPAHLGYPLWKCRPAANGPGSRAPHLPAPPKEAPRAADGANAPPSTPLRSSSVSFSPRVPAPGAMTCLGGLGWGSGEWDGFGMMGKAPASVCPGGVCIQQRSRRRRIPGAGIRCPRDGGGFARSKAAARAESRGSK